MNGSASDNQAGPTLEYSHDLRKQMPIRAEVKRLPFLA